MQVLDLFRRRSKPFLLLGPCLPLQVGNRGGRDEASVLRKDSDGNHCVPVRLVEQVHPRADAVLRQVGVLDHPVIHRVGDPHHAAQIAVKIEVHLVENPAAVLGEQRVGRGGKAQQQRTAEQDHSDHSDDGKREGDHDLDAGAPVPYRKPPHHRVEKV